MSQSAFEPIHPGEILLEDFMKPLGVTQYRLAKETEVPPRRINEIVQGQRSVTADTALRLAKFFGTSEMFWLNLQARYDLELQKRKIAPVLSSVRSLTQLRESSTPMPRAVRETVRTSRTGVVRSGYRRKVK
jgi:addiction module HigA family antidote